MPGVGLTIDRGSTQTNLTGLRALLYDWLIGADHCSQSPNLTFKSIARILHFARYVNWTFQHAVSDTDTKEEVGSFSLPPAIADSEKGCVASHATINPAKPFRKPRNL